MFDFKPKFFYLIAMVFKDRPNTVYINDYDYSFACFDTMTNSYPPYSNMSADANGFGKSGSTGNIGSLRTYTCTRSKIVGNTFSWFSQVYYDYPSSSDETDGYADSSGTQYNAKNSIYYWIAIG